MIRFLFWFSILVVAYSYFGYGILLWFLVRIRQLFSSGIKITVAGGFEPPVTLVVSAYNEAGFIAEKIANTFALDYPESKLDLIFITDGSSDDTAAIVSDYPRIRLLHEPERRGKVAAMNRAIGFVKTPYVIFSDANTLLNTNCVRAIAAHYAEPLVGGVAGEKKILSGSREKAAGAGEGIYWKYESALKKLDSDFYSVVGAAGELFSVKTDLFEKAPESTIIEDFVLSLKICMKGYRIRYEPGAYASETSSASMKDEQKRKTRISAGAFQAMGMLKPLFNPFRYPALFFQFISHRILRWTLCPLCLLIAFVANVLLLTPGKLTFYNVVFAVQLVFYATAIVGWVLAGRNIKVKLLFIPYYFFFMNASVYLGFIRFLRKKQSSVWEKAARQHLVHNNG